MAETILHFGAVRMRVNGSGSLTMSLYSLDEVESQILTPFTMAVVTDREPTQLCNFNSQRAKLRVKTVNINEYFKINRIIIYAKPLWSSFPDV